MEVEKYINQKKDLHESFLDFIDNDDLEYNFFEIIKKHHVNENQEELNHFFEMLISIANNHYRVSNFFDKIEQIILFFKKEIKQNLSNYDIYNMFESNKRLLLFLFEQEILILDENIYKLINHKIEPNGMRYSDFFIPEMKKFKNPDQIDNQSNEIIEYEKKRHEGENDNYICSLIRQDSVEEFIAFTNRKNFPLSSKIERSTFETHSFLNLNQPTLIEYAAFFGSIQIFQYLYFNKVNVSDSLWLYAIHSNNSDLLCNQIEKNSIRPENDESYENCLKESIKCHHNGIADYIKYNLFIEPNDQREKANLNEQIASIIFKNCNYSYFPISFDEDFMFFNLFAANENKIDVVYFLLLNENKIEKKLFNSIKNLTKIAIPDSIISIGDHAFFECSQLSQIVLPLSLKSIGKYAFSRCDSLIQIQLPSHVVSIGDYAFFECKKLSQIILPSSLKLIKKHAFDGCSSLRQIEIPLNVIDIGDYAFFECTKLSQIILPSSLKLIKKHAFDGCSSLQQIEIPINVIDIGDYAFYKCKNLRSVLLPPYLTTINSHVFDGCVNLKRINIPDSVTDIGYYAFRECKSLNYLKIPSSVTEIGYNAFFYCISLREIEIPPSVTILGEYSFYNCKLLDKILVPSTLNNDELKLCFDSNANITFY